jgi:primosomal protein N' (replication factor Y)
MSYYVDVILPIPVNQKFTYLISKDEYDYIKPGMRIIVPFGKSKLYTSISVKIYNFFQSDYELKSIIQIIDKTPIVNVYQLKFWDWISRYYFTSIGEVMRASIPSNLILQSETIISLNNENEIDKKKLDDNEYLIIEALNINKELSIKNVSDILSKKNIFSIINKMNEKRLIRVDEKIYSKYKPKFIRCVRLNKDFDSNSVMSIIKNAKSQIKFFEYYKRLKKQSTEDISVSEFKKLNSGYSAIIKRMIEKEIFEYYDVEVKRNIIDNDYNFKEFKLTDVQKTAFDEIKIKFSQNKNILFKGITSSGKTEIYISLIKEILNSKNQILYLVPEIALTTQLVERLKVYFAKNLVVYHSGLNINQRAELWNEIIKNEKPQVIIGARSAVLLPYNKLKLIIVDEEHEQSYKQYEPSPRYHARDAALMLGNIHASNVILGSATPSLESFYNSKTSKKLSLVELNSRFGNIPLPKIELINLSDKVKKGKMHGLFSDSLLKRIKDVIDNKKQVILFQNRRGYSPVLECNSCGHSPKCVNCDVTLTYHYSKKLLKCHYCGYNEKLNSNCFKCDSDDLLSKGFGTEQVELELKEFFPKMRVARLDYDTTRAKNKFKTIINSFDNHEYDILVGTQMITKGLDFKNVQLVGVLNLDSSMNFPDFRSYERSFQLIQQVSGRAGRSKERGEVMIQTYNSKSTAVNQIITGDYEMFYDDQLNDREKFNYPPFIKLIKITFKHKELNKVNNSSNWFFKKIYPYFKENLLGPEFPYISRIRNKYQKNILLKITNDQSLSAVKNILKKSILSFQSVADFRSIQIIVDVDPY